MPLTPGSLIDRTFGAGFFAGIKTAKEGEWIGPIKSGYGYHLVRVTKLEPGKLQPLEKVRGDVLRDWSTERSKQVAEQMYANILKRYTIRRPDLQDSDLTRQ